MAARLQPVAVLGEDRFRAIAEREQRFFDSQLFAALAERQALRRSPWCARPASPGSRRNVQ